MKINEEQVALLKDYFKLQPISFDLIFNLSVAEKENGCFELYDLHSIFNNNTSDDKNLHKLLFEIGLKSDESYAEFLEKQLLPPNKNYFFIKPYTILNNLSLYKAPIGKIQAIVSNFMKEPTREAFWDCVNLSSLATHENEVITCFATCLKSLDNKTSLPSINDIKKFKKILNLRFSEDRINSGEIKIPTVFQNYFSRLDRIREANPISNKNLHISQFVIDEEVLSYHSNINISKTRIQLKAILSQLRIFLDNTKVIRDKLSIVGVNPYKSTNNITTFDIIYSDDSKKSFLEQIINLTLEKSLTSDGVNFHASHLLTQEYLHPDEVFMPIITNEILKLELAKKNTSSPRKNKI